MIFPGGKLKAFTLSYDDGIGQDERLVEIFNKYGLRCTFNLNSGRMTGDDKWVNNGVTIRRLKSDKISGLYKDHEIACHALTHPHLETMQRDEIKKEIAEDKKNLEELTGRPVIGMAYPFGTYNDEVISVIKECGIKYSRTVESTHSFDICSDFYKWGATCHHNDEKLMDLAEQFVNLKTDKPQVFYLWGHSYEFDVYNNWEIIERLCEYISGRDDIFYATNGEIYNAFNAK